MSDFVSEFWHLYVAGLSIVSIIACLLLLWFSGKVKAMTANDNTTGHVWDGDLREMNNPLPRWWVGLFIITVVFSLVYLAFYPGLGTNQGTLKWTSVGQYEAEQAKARSAMEPVYAKYKAMTPEQLAADAGAMAIGQRLYLNNCAQCHGSDARGSKGFPNLTDRDWLWGGSFTDIQKTIAEGRNGVMPPMADAVGGGEHVRNVAHYVLSLSSSPHDSVAAQLGRSRFTTCAACHGADGKGNPAMGAPNLTDNVWLHGWGEPAITSIITAGKNNAMPAHANRLTPEQIRVLAAYVWRLSNEP